MKTPMGVEMSPRATRIYGHLQANGANLTPFSTDQCVAACLPRLREILAKLEAGGDPGWKYTLRDLNEMVTDLRAIMGRTPENRV